MRIYRLGLLAILLGSTLVLQGCHEDMGVRPDHYDRYDNHYDHRMIPPPGIDDRNHHWNRNHPNGNGWVNPNPPHHPHRY